MLFVMLASAPVSALDPEACSVAAKQIDDRIAAGNHSAQNVAIAVQLRDGIKQSCPYLDETTLGNMLQGLDHLLPHAGNASVTPEKTAAERDAERAAQRAEAAERRAERDKRRAAAQARREAEQNLISEVVKKPPTARSTKGQPMTRQDGMWGVSIVDWDFHDGKARLLYSTWPSREQGKLPEAARHFYVVEFDKSDTIEQHRIVETGVGRTVTAGLLRGHDEVIIQWHEGRSKPVAATLERWSIVDKKLRSSTRAPTMRGPNGNVGQDQHFDLVTANGELLYVHTVPLESGPSPRTGVVWMLASPDGEVRDQGVIEHTNEKVSTSDWFHAAGGGAGLILDVTADGDEGIDSRLRLDSYRLGSSEVRPLVFSERRLYVVSGAETGAGLPAFRRQLLWTGLEDVDQAVMISGESTRLMDRVEGEYRARDSDVSQAVAGRHRMAIEASGVGHAILIRNSHRNDDFPPRHGLWLQEFAAGKPRRDTYLDPDVSHLKSRFNLLAGDGGNQLYVASPKWVMLLDEEREITAYARSVADKADVKAMIADGSSVWLFGEHHGGSSSQQQVWVERIQF